MTTQARKDLSKRALSLWASDGGQDANALLAPGYVNHQEPSVRGEVVAESRDSYVDLLSEYHRAFSESVVDILLQVAEGDLVATRWEITATNTGEYLGNAPTGTTATWTGVQIDRSADGLVVESWVDWDKYRLLEALGIVG